MRAYKVLLRHGILLLVGMKTASFTSVVISLIAHIQAGHVNSMLTLARLGLQECDFMDPILVSRALQTAVVDEWLGENSDHYQGFTTVDI